MKNTLLLSISIFLVACSAPEATITPNVPVTISPTLILTPTFSTSTPTQSPSLSPTVIQTQVTSEQLFIATQSVFQTEVAKFPRLCPKDIPYFSDTRKEFSPDGLWLSELCLSPEEGLVLTFSNKNTQVVWKMFYHDYIPDINYADGGMSVIHWSNDSRYAYFYSWLGGDGGECFYKGYDTGAGVFRLDLQTGHTTEILPTNDIFFWYGFSFSPTDRRLVYGVRAQDLIVLDIKKGESINVEHKKDFSQAGGYVWSSDGLQFIYSTVEYLPNNIGTVAYTLRLVDARTGVEQILLESQTSCYLAKKWGTDNILQIEYDDENYNRAIMEYDINSKTIISVSARPSP